MSAGQQTQPGIESIPFEERQSQWYGIVTEEQDQWELVGLPVPPPSERYPGPMNFGIRVWAQSFGR